MLGLFKVKIKDNDKKGYIKNIIYLYRHFENMYIILLNQTYKQNKEDINHFTNTSIMKAFLNNTEGGKNKEVISYLQNKYSNHQLINDMKGLTNKLKDHNLVMLMKKVIKDSKSTFTKWKKGDTKAKLPKTKKLSKLTNYTIQLDNSASYSLKRKNQLGFNLLRKRDYLYINHESILKIVKEFFNIQNISIHYSNGELYLLFLYYKEVKDNVIKDLPYKNSGIDIGINNLISLYINDTDSESLIISGKPYKHYNVKFNRFIGKLNTSIEKEDNEFRKKYLIKFRRFIYEKRNRYFYSEFHKISKLVVDYLKKNGVTEITLSKTLAELKNNGKTKLSRSAKQNFIQIPFINLLTKIEEKCKESNINVIYVNEAYTSKTSSISENIVQIQSMLINNPSLTNVYKFSGKRVKRGLFEDIENKTLINADLNGARNICYLNKNDRFIPYNSINKRKLNNPTKLSNPDSTIILDRVIG